MSIVTAGQSRPLKPMYPVVFVDVLRVNICEVGLVGGMDVSLMAKLK
jgi:transposase-like protein